MGYEWLNFDEKELDYHKKQYQSPKRYTLELIEICKKFNLLKDTKRIIDIGCGAGAVTNLFAQYFPSIKFEGCDLNPYYIEYANSQKHINSSFSVVDIYNNLNSISNEPHTGIFCFQTLSWLPNYDIFIKVLNSLKPNWSMVTSLFYDGPIDAEIQIKDYTRHMGDFNYRKSYYNIYSIPIFNANLTKIGYEIKEILPFIIDIDLPKPDNKSMSTFTEKLNSGNRVQISGPLMMSWYTLIINKI